MKASPQALFAVGASIVVLAVVAVGLFLNGSPAEVRRQRLDNQRIQDLRSISQAIDATFRRGEGLPESLDALEQEPRRLPMRVRDPVTGEAYEYRVTTAPSYELCANFETSSTGAPEFEPDNAPFWQHGPGRHCFTFTARPAESPLR